MAKTRAHLVAGADALRDIFRQLREKSDADLEDTLEDEDHPDLCDYRAMAKMVDDNIAAHLVRAKSDHREGFLRALTHLLLLAADGCAVSDDWDPLGATAAAFDAPLAACTAIDAARRQAV